MTPGTLAVDIFLNVDLLLQWFCLTIFSTSFCLFLFPPASTWTESEVPSFPKPHQQDVFHQSWPCLWQPMKLLPVGHTWRNHKCLPTSPFFSPAGWTQPERKTQQNVICGCTSQWFFFLNVHLLPSYRFSGKWSLSPCHLHCFEPQVWHSEGEEGDNPRLTTMALSHAREELSFSHCTEGGLWLAETQSVQAAGDLEGTRRRLCPLSCCCCQCCVCVMSVRQFFFHSSFFQFYL